VKLLVDANLSPTVAISLRSSGHNVEHVFEVGLGTAQDSEIFDYAIETGRIVISCDTDFGVILAQRQTMAPSLMLLRHMNDTAPIDQARLVAGALNAAAEQLAVGAIVTLSRGHLRTRSLPLGRRPVDPNR
jgi:predicted nuclease of predicted toxin-antitoxin system